MKKYLLLLFLLLSFSAWGQLKKAQYKIEFNNLRYILDKGIKNATTDTYVSIEVVYADGTRQGLYLRYFNDQDDDVPNWNLATPIITDKKPIGIRNSGHIDWRTGDNARWDSTLGLGFCNTVYHTFDTGTRDDWMSNITYNFKITPIHSLDAEKVNDIPNTFLPADDKITLYAGQGFSPEMYRYQYRLQGTSTWTDITSSFSNLEKLSVSAKDLFGATYQQYLGNKVEFRVVSCLDNGSYQSFSDPVVLTIVPSAPRILSAASFPVKCFDSTDGSVVLNFDRLLLTGETIEGALVNTVTNTAVTFTFPTDALQNSTSVTIENLAPGNYRLDIKGTYGGEATYSDAPQHSFIFEILKPSPVQFSLATKTDVFCFNGTDGNINLSASGGQGSYQYAITGDNGLTIDWTNFNNGVSTSIDNLAAGTYQIKVRDANQCVAKEGGAEKVLIVTITQPSAAIALTEIAIKEPSGYGLGNGYISVRVTGGTPENGGLYNFEWRKDNAAGALITTGIITDAVNNPFTIKLDGLAAGKYYLTVKDKNYANASSELNNCGIISKEFIVTEPLPLVVTIAAKQLISCHIANDYAYRLDNDNNGVPDDAEDASLLATITGGVGTYKLQWQKQVGGAFQNIDGADLVSLGKLTAGTYKILVTDANQNATEAQQVLVFPEQLKISLTANTIKCNNANEGQVSVVVTGGVAPYTYMWSTGDTTPTVSGLGAGSYMVMIQDVNKCSISGQVTIEQPGQLKITDVLIQNPICYGASNGVIQVKATGGSAPYTLKWSTGETGENIANLKAGVYSIVFTDANGCSTTRSYTLTDPEQRKVDLGKDITLCVGDSKTYDVKIDDAVATYKWTDGNGTVISTGPTVTLSTAGNYSVLITDKNGCTATDNLTVLSSTAVLNPEFLIPTHVYIDYTVKLVNTSPTKPEKVEWIIPATSDVKVVSKNDEYVELRFMKTGSYQIGLKGMEGACEKIQFKNVVVEENTNGVVEVPKALSNVEAFLIAPNPNSGQYKVSIKLFKEAPIKLRILDINGREVYPPSLQAKAAGFEVPFNYTLSSGVYFIILETGTESQMKKMIVN